MLKGFRDFIFRGNVVDLAVAVIMGAAFGAVVTAVTKNVIMQFVAAIFKAPDFDKLAFMVNGTPILYGTALTALTNFLIIAGVVYFFVVMPLNYLMSKAAKAEPAPEVTTKPCDECLADIPLGARRCRFCAQPVA